MPRMGQFLGGGLRRDSEDVHWVGGVIGICSLPGSKEHCQTVTNVLEAWSLIGIDLEARSSNGLCSNSQLSSARLCAPRG